MQSLLHYIIICLLFTGIPLLISSSPKPEKNQIKIVLSGPPRSGKTTILEKVIHKLSESNQKFYGCIVQEILDKNQKRTGFKNVFIPESREIILASKKTPYSNIFVGSNNVNIKNIKNSLIPFIEKMVQQPKDTILIFDEIGRIQNSVDSFTPAIKNLFSTPHVLISTIVHDDEIWARPFKNKDLYFQIIVTPINREDVPEILLLLLQTKDQLEGLPPKQFKVLIKKFNDEIQHSSKKIKTLIHQFLP